VHYLRSLDDSDSLASAFGPGTRVVVIGAGWIGLETAAAARTAGAEVTVLEHARLPLLGVLGPQLATVFADLHLDHGVDLRCGVTVESIQPAGADPSTAGAVRLADGTELDAEVVIVGVGVTPNVELARSCGLNVDNGILVDRHLSTSDPDILAAGDVANAYHPLLCRQLRVEHWANALHQPGVAARTMLGRPAVYDRLPYFFTDQYDLGMEYTGYTHPDDDDQVVIRGDTQTREFIAFWLHDERVVAAMNVNTWDVAEQLRTLIEGGTRLDPVKLADLDVPLA
jgi:3-phenylpropionate/trans-cinnamate dioxygenase ferredoxin reductase subunit